MTETLASPTAAADAPDFAEYKKRRREQKDSASQPAVNETDSTSDVDNSESGAAGETNAAAESGSDSEPGVRNQKRDRSAQGRIAGLTEKLRKAEQELAELRKGNRNPEAPKPAEPPRTEAKPAAAAPSAAAEGEPDLQALIEAEIRDTTNKTYEQAQAKALKKYLAAQKTWEASEAERERSARDAQTAHEARLQKTRERHQDFDEVVSAAIPQVEGIHNPGIEAAMAHSDSADVVYYFATHLDEYRRIAQMKPQAAYRETLRLDLMLASDGEKHAPASPPASRAPAPPAIPRGTSTRHTPKNPAEARDYAEYKRLRAARN